MSLGTTAYHPTLPNTVRRERHNGREYIVAPVTLLVPGVLNGSDGALLYPDAEVAKTAQAWNGMPLTIGHPRSAGRPVSAATSGVQHIGSVRNTSMTGGRLIGEGWFDVAATGRVHPKLLRSLERGESVEVSTGLNLDKRPAPVGATHEGRTYTHIATNYRPDHLAVLTDEEGACSLKDGCGVNNHAGCCPSCGEDAEETARRIMGYYTAYIQGGEMAAFRANTMPVVDIDWATGEVVERW